MTEVIPPDAYRLKDNDDDALTKHLGTARSFSFPLSFSLTIIYLTHAPIRAPDPNVFRLGGSTRGHYYLSVLFTVVWRNSFLP